jgi:predicted AlkP superfamily pyrophosphatase or phosphodiesterase
MNRIKLFIVLLISCFISCKNPPQPYSRPKLVVGIVIDQMRWDYLYRYYNHYGNDGFKRLLNGGFNCQNTMINYIPSFTGPGHACIYTGSVPAINGISGNDWIDNQTCKSEYCVRDANVQPSDDTTQNGSYSPANLLTTTITDELRLATNYRSRVYGIAVKDRGAILPAGHAANAAYWYNDKTGDFVTSTYYDKKYQNPAWLQKFNKKNIADSLSKMDWSLLHKPAYYTESTNDTSAYEYPFKGETLPVFPHKFSSLSKGERLGTVKATPAGNTLTFLAARACMEGADGGKLGHGKETDFLCVSLSSTDYAGHQFAPNSREIEDMYLRLDKEIATFLHYLDASVGEGNYLLFLTADHGAAHNPQFLKDRKIPGGIAFNLTADLNMYLKEQFGTPSLVRNILNYQVFLNDSLIAATPTLDRDKIKYTVGNWLLNSMPQKYHVPVSFVIDLEDPSRNNAPEPIRTMAINGYNHLRSGCIQIILNPGWFEGEKYTGTTHGTWNPYDTHIPLLWYGWHIPQGETHKQVYMTDIAPTLAAMLHIQMPNGCVGKPIDEVIPR